MKIRIIGRLFDKPVDILAEIASRESALANVRWLDARSATPMSVSDEGDTLVVRVPPDGEKALAAYIDEQARQERQLQVRDN